MGLGYGEGVMRIEDAYRHLQRVAVTRRTGLKSGFKRLSTPARVRLRRHQLHLQRANGVSAQSLHRGNGGEKPQ